MHTRLIVGFVLLPFMLLLAAWEIASYRLWSPAASLALPWLCTAIAVAVLILGIVCLLLQVPPASIPRKTACLVVVAVLALFGVALAVDVITFLNKEGWTNAIAGWLGFAVVLSGVFALPQTKIDRD